VSDINAPSDPSTSISYRAAKLTVIVLSALIILALVGLVAGVIWKLSGHTASPASGGAFVLPPDAKVVTMETQPGRVILHVHGPEGDEIDILSTDDGHLVAQIKSPPPTVPQR
jgi:hypothetical protein